MVAHPAVQGTRVEIAAELKLCQLKIAPARTHRGIFEYELNVQVGTAVCTGLRYL